MSWKSRVIRPKTTTSKHDFGILPTELEFEELDQMFNAQSTEELKRFWSEIRDLERHEDNLFNSRFQSLLVSTSFLIGAFFSVSGKGLLYARVLLCLAALIFTWQVKAVMMRSARAIEWYLAALIRMDKKLFPEPLQPYRFRRRQAGRLNEKNRPVGGRPVLGRMAILFPNGIAALWICLLLWAILGFEAGSIHRFMSESHASQASPISQPRLVPMTKEPISNADAKKAGK